MSYYEIDIMEFELQPKPYEPQTLLGKVKNHKDVTRTEID